jgi:hypothetical protein
VHARRPAFEHAHDQFHRRGDGGDFDEGQAQEPDVGADAALFGRKRGIHEPAGIGRGVEKDRATDEDATDQETPIAERGQPGKRQVPRTQHGRQDQDGDRLEDRNREQEHHHRAVQGEDLVVEVGR